MTLTSKPAFQRPFGFFTEPGRYWLPKLLKDADMTLSNAEGRRMIKQQGGLWIDRWSARGLDDSTIYERLEKIWPHLDGEEIQLEEHWIVCVGRRIDDAVCHRILACSC